MPEEREPKVLRVRIDREDVMRFGATAGCPGCIAVNRGDPHKQHTDECRLRLEGELRRAGSKKMKRADDRINESIAKRLEAQDQAERLEMPPEKSRKREERKKKWK